MSYTLPIKRVVACLCRAVEVPATSLRLNPARRRAHDLNERAFTRITLGNPETIHQVEWVGVRGGHDLAIASTAGIAVPGASLEWIRGTVLDHLDVARRAEVRFGIFF